MDTPAEMASPHCPPSGKAYATIIAVPRGGESALRDPRVGSVRRLPAPSGVKDPFHLGSRAGDRHPDGRRVLEQIPLTPEDPVYPQEGDVDRSVIPKAVKLRSVDGRLAFALEGANQHTRDSRTQEGRSLL